MPLVFVQRYSAATLPAGVGQQTGNVLTLPNSGTVEVGFDSATWTGAQKGVAYTIFSFTSITGSVSTLVANAADLTALGLSGATFALVGNTITVTFS